MVCRRKNLPCGWRRITFVALVFILLLIFLAINTLILTVPVDESEHLRSQIFRGIIDGFADRGGRSARAELQEEDEDMKADRLRAARRQDLISKVVESTASDEAIMKVSQLDSNEDKKPRSLPEKYRNSLFSGWPDKSYNWAGVTKDRSDDVAFATYYAQNELWKHQHPADCTNKTFGILSAQDSGLGSQWHILGALFAITIDAGRIALWGDGMAAGWFDGEHCRNTHGFACFFQDLSNCTLTREQTREARRWGPDLPRLKDKRAVMVTTISARRVNFPLMSGTPKRFHELLEYYQEDPKFWWRTQASTFMLRPNIRTLDRINTILSNHTIAPELPSGCVSMHVRHGDKYREMRLHPLEEYVDWAEKMLFEDSALVKLTPDLSEAREARTIFLSTEDPKVIEEAAELKNWNFVWLHEKLTNANMHKLSRQGAERVIKDLATIKLHLRCHASVVTFGSNWNRLLEELKSTLGIRPHAPVWDINNACLYRENQGCIDNPKNFDYDW